MAYQFASVARTTSSEAAGSQPIDPFLTRLLSNGTLTREQVRIVTAMQSPPRSVPARTQLARAGGSATSTYVIREGWAFAYSLLAGGERQVVGFLLPGDIIPFECSGHGSAELGVETVTDMIVSEVTSAAVRAAAQQWPEVFVLFLRHQSEMMLGLIGHLTDLGRRDARARIAQLLLKLERRLAPVGLTEFDGYDCPISQYLIADALGLTAIHVNRVLRGLREQGIVTVRSNRVTIHDRARLMAIAGEDDGDDVG